MAFRSLLALLVAISLNTCVATTTLQVLGTSVLGVDPQTVNRLNGESFQQDALVTFNGYQYSAFYDAQTSKNSSIRYVSVARRDLSQKTGWETLTLKDYEQTDDDGHNIISLGISHADGSLHLGFDQHDNDLNYRVSRAGVATLPHSVVWDSSLFGPVTDVLPGLENLNKSIFFINVTYPRFLSIPSAPSDGQSNTASMDLLMELRVGRSGLGDDWLYAYIPSSGENDAGKWSMVGRYLEGVNNNAYINGLDFDSNRALHVSWTYRDFINDTGQDVAVEAGPNGPENNHDMDYAFSPDLGHTWINNWNQTIALVSSSSSTSNESGSGDPVQGDTILPNSAGITIFSIPKYGGILNQEAQTVDGSGRVHVLNRENTTGSERWYHYWRTPTSSTSSGFWTRTALPLDIEGDPNAVTRTPTVIGKRGKLLSVTLPTNSSTRSGTEDSEPNTYLLAILPSNAANSSALTIIASTSSKSSEASRTNVNDYQSQFTDWRVVWSAPNGSSAGTSAAEPLFDRYRLAEDGVLSLFLVSGTRDSSNTGSGTQREGGEITVLDLSLKAIFGEEAVR